MKTRPIAFVLLGVMALYFAFKIYAYSQQDNVREAAVRGYVRVSKTKILFVSIDGHDADDAFLARFRGGTTLVRRPTDGVRKNSLMGDSWGDHYIDKATAQRGQELSLGHLSWKGPFIAQVEVGHPGFGERFTVILSWRGWIYRNKTRTWIA